MRAERWWGTRLGRHLQVILRILAFILYVMKNYGGRVGKEEACCEAHGERRIIGDSLRLGAAK